MEVDLPEEIWGLIFRFLDNNSLQNSQLVCRRWLEIILNDVVLTGKYNLMEMNVNSSQINNILIKRKKLKVLRCNHHKYYVNTITDDEATNLEEDGITVDLRFVNFQVCKDLTKVIVRRNLTCVTPELPNWISWIEYCYNPQTQSPSYCSKNASIFSWENVVLLHLYLSPENSTAGIIDESLEAIGNQMTNLEELSFWFSDDLKMENIGSIIPLLRGLQVCNKLKKLVLGVNGMNNDDYPGYLR